MLCAKSFCRSDGRRYLREPIVGTERADRHRYVGRRLPVNHGGRFGDGEARTSLKGKRPSGTDEQDRQ